MHEIKVRGNRKMIRRKPLRAMALVLSVVLLSASSQPSVRVHAAAAGEESSQGTSAVVTYSDERITHNYAVVSREFGAAYTGETLKYPVDALEVSGTGELTSESYGYTESSVVARAEIGDELSLTFDVPQAAVYYLKFDYISCADSILSAEASLQVNGEFPYYELRSLEFENLWVDAEPSYDRYGNQIVSIPDKVYEWQGKYLLPGGYRYTTPLGVELAAGKNTLTFKVSEGALLIGAVSLCPEPVIPAYTGSQKAEGDGIIEIQAETPDRRNDSAIRATCEYNTDLSPYNVKNKALNIIDASSFKNAGQSLTYEFEAQQAGYYNLAVHYSQADKTDFPVFMNVEIDGQIINEKFKDYAFAYDKDYEMLTLKDGEGNNLTAYLSEGTHRVTFTISVDPIRGYLEKVDRIMNDVNNLSLEITKVVGTNKDKYRDFKLEAYIPGIGETLKGWAAELDAIKADASKFNPKAKKIGTLSSLDIASNQLKSLSKDVNELLYRIGELATSRNSVNQYLANLTDALNGNRISIDSVYFYQDGAKNQLPKKTGFWKGIWASVSRFFYSFTSQAYSTSNTDPSHLQVWVNRSRQHLEIMQKLIDEDFTPTTGIVVDLSLMPDQNKLVLANASGDAPDIATGLNYAQPYELAIRGALKDLTEFDDFAQVATRYNEALFVPATIGDGIYAVPETMNFWVLFYRSDVLSKLGLEVPDTIEDVKGMLTDLQMRGLNFYHPTAGMAAMRNFHGTTPILFQYGASLYDTYAGDTAINSEAAVAGFTELAELFTIYNMPVDIPNFYQHFRNGDLPIGIADFGTYNLILNAAPEIASSWEIAMIPGITQADGTVARYSSAGAESTIMFESDEKREAMAWEFMKWWSSADIQEQFGESLQISYGSEYLWNTANKEAFANLPWRSQDKAVILAQNEWIQEAPRIPGTYMLERELSNAFVKVAIDGEDIRSTLDAAVKRINRETERKLEEFGYMKDGEVVTEYVVPTIERVREIIGITK